MDRYYVERKNYQDEWTPAIGCRNEKECLIIIKAMRHLTPYEEFRAVEVVDVRVIG